MGFKNGAYATIWTVEPVSDINTKARISISRKNKQTGMYENDFSGFVSFIGTTAAPKAANLKEKDRIRLGDVECRTFYQKEKKVTYYNFNVYSFEMADEVNPTPRSATPDEFDASNMNVGDGEVDEKEYPF